MMSMMRFVLIASGLLVGGCGGGNKPPAQEPGGATATADQVPSNTQPEAAPAPSPTSPMIAKMREFADAVCACKDAACVQGVSDDMTKWSQEAAKSNTEPKIMTEDDKKQAVEIGTRMTECMRTAMEAGSP